MALLIAGVALTIFLGIYVATHIKRIGPTWSGWKPDLKQRTDLALGQWRQGSSTSDSDARFSIRRPVKWWIGDVSLSPKNAEVKLRCEQSLESGLCMNDFKVTWRWIDGDWIIDDVTMIGTPGEFIGADTANSY